jgi:hypothetical protein
MYSPDVGVFVLGAAGVVVVSCVCDRTFVRRGMRAAQQHARMSVQQARTQSVCILLPVASVSYAPSSKHNHTTLTLLHEPARAVGLLPKLHVRLYLFGEKRRHGACCV